MREIIFRGKSVNTGEWIAGDLIHYESGEVVILERFSGYGYEATEIYRRDRVIPETVGQYTGLTDKNGERIFEGDIVEILREDEHLEVEWAKEEARFIFQGSTFICDFDNYWANEIEVIGNMHDTPELLGGDKE